MSVVSRQTAPASEWPVVSYVITSAVVLPLLVLELLDMACVLAIHTRVPRIQGDVIVASDWLLIPGYAFCAFWPSRRGKEGTYLAVLGIYLSLVVCFNFRGSFLRLGTFDAFAAPSWSWLRFVVIGGILGAVLGFIWDGKRTPPPVAGAKQYVWLPLILIVAGIVSHLVGERLGVSSMWAPTRVYALTAVGMLLLLLVGAAKFSGRLQ
jgi:hypothetical protein